MKDYRPGKWGIGFIFSLEGSVIPRALCCALPNALLAVGCWYFWRLVVDEDIYEIAMEGTSVGQVWTGYNWVLGFTVAFRTQRAYSRWWEGGTLLQQARGEWFNAYSSLIAFCTQDTKKRAEVAKFQQTLARLMSMLYASALMSIATEPDLDFEIIDATGMNERHLDYLRTQPDKCEIIMQWVQRLIVDNMGDILPIPPPVISRVFQELSRGIVNIHNVRKITEFQFPFPAAQMIVVMLMVQWVLTPTVTSLLVGSPIWAFILSFFPIFACWGINYLAGELEQPFGTDYNDMPLHFMQASMNTSILALLDPEAQSPPEFDMTRKKHVPVTMVDPGKSGGSPQNLDRMRSVRCVTISDPLQLNRIKHRFTQGRDFEEQRRSRLSSLFDREGTMEWGSEAQRDSCSSSRSSQGEQRVRPGKPPSMSGLLDQKAGRPVGSLRSSNSSTTPLEPLDVQARLSCLKEERASQMTLSSDFTSRNSEVSIEEEDCDTLPQSLPMLRGAAVARRPFMEIPATPPQPVSGS